MADDPFDLDRFVRAQNHAGTFDHALAELRRERKESHWMWFVFPQVAGLGRSEIARRYAIAGLDEARAYLAHPLLGPRLLECARVVAEMTAAPAVVFGVVDAQKLHSSMTLFLRADPSQSVFAQVLQRHFGGRPDPGTDGRLTSGPDRPA